MLFGIGFDLLFLEMEWMLGEWETELEKQGRWGEKARGGRDCW